MHTHAYTQCTHTHTHTYTHTHTHTFVEGLKGLFSALDLHLGRSADVHVVLLVLTKVLGLGRPAFTYTHMHVHGRYTVIRDSLHEELTVHAIDIMMKLIHVTYIKKYVRRLSKGMLLALF